MLGIEEESRLKEKTVNYELLMCNCCKLRKGTVISSFCDLNTNPKAYRHSDINTVNEPTRNPEFLFLKSTLRLMGTVFTQVEIICLQQVAWHDPLHPFI